MLAAGLGACKHIVEIVLEDLEACLLRGKPEVREASARAEASVRSGVMTAGDGAESVLRALGIA